MAFPFTTLPVELQQQCIDYLDKETVMSMRLVTTNVSSMATAGLFRVVCLLGRDQSAGRFEKILTAEKFSRHVRKIIIQTTENPWARPHYDGSELEKMKQFDDQDLQSWLAAIRKLGRFPNLKEIETIFAVECAIEIPHDLNGMDPSETEPFRTAVLDLVFSVINEDVANIETLTITNFQDATNSQFYETPAVKSVQSRVRKLNLCIATEPDDASPGDSVDIVGRHEFFKHTLKTFWLEPMRGHLTHLSLFCDDHWGIYPYCDFQGLRIPNLKSLALGNWTIAWDWQIDWITSHGATLEELILDNCPIVHAAKMNIHVYDNKWPKLARGTGRGRNRADDRLLFPTLRWGTIFPLFQQKLQKLRKFGFGSRPDLGDHSFELRYSLPPKLDASRYCIFHYGMGPTPWITYDDGSKYGYDPSEGLGPGYRSIEMTWERQKLGEHVEHLKYPDPKNEEQGALDGFLQSMGRRKGNAQGQSG